jgi:glycosyltransferase involved in cell wall biosynthesis
MGVDCEILVADHVSCDGTEDVCYSNGAVCLLVEERGYGKALRTAFAAATGDYVLTMDADLSHPSDFIRTLWENREKADMVIASRYVEGGEADMSLWRLMLSRILNLVFRKVLAIPVRDLSSGFRLTRRSVLESLELEADDFNILQEILVKSIAGGRSVAEVPFSYRRRESGESHARLFAFGVQYLKTLGRMRRIRSGSG